MPSKEVPKLLLAHSWDPYIDPTGYWMSEKLDGIRAYWTGEKFLTRLGGELVVPEWFTKNYPSYPLDGELFGGRGKFNMTVSIVKSKNLAPIFMDRWECLKYVVFDAPNCCSIGVDGVTPETFEQRMGSVDTACSNHLMRNALPSMEVLKFTLCEGEGHLYRELDRVEKLGGEGLMLRKAKSLYEPKRSKTLLKVKTFHDAEAKIIAHENGLGRNTGRLGALLCELPNGKTFSVGSGFTDEEREYPPKVGSMITYRYQELTQYGIPRFPTFVRVRTDI